MAKDILLATINAKWIHPSLALRLLKANLGSLENACEIFEFALRQPLVEKVGPILAAGPRILALSVSIWNHLQTLELLKALYTAWDGKGGQGPTQKPAVVLGGPEVSWLPEDADIFRYADYVIRGEGEESFRSLCLTLLDDERPEKKKENGDAVFINKSSAVFINKGGDVVNVNEISSAYRLYTDEDLKQKLVYVEASRGCPFACEFCQASMVPVREFPLEPFLAGMETLIERGAGTFKFLDRTFNLNLERCKKIMGFFLEKINSRADSGAKEKPLCVHFEMVPGRFPPELLEIIRFFPPGTLRLEIGIQTLNPKTASLIGRPGNSRESPGSGLGLGLGLGLGPIEDLKTIGTLRRETNAILHIDLIAGLPGEDLASFAAGFDRLWQTLTETGGAEFKSGADFKNRAEHQGGQATEIQLGILKNLPGTSIARHNEAYGMRYSDEPPYEVLETGALPAAQLEQVKNFARFWEIIVNRNSFPGIIPQLLPPGKPVFKKFMALSCDLLQHFGRNWGLEKKELKTFLENASNQVIRHSDNI